MTCILHLKNAVFRLKQNAKDMITNDMHHHFLTNSSLKLFRVHRSEPEFQCQHCDKRFFTPTSVRAHKCSKNKDSSDTNAGNQSIASVPSENADDVVCVINCEMENGNGQKGGMDATYHLWTAEEHLALLDALKLSEVSIVFLL